MISSKLTQIILKGVYMIKVVVMNANWINTVTQINNFPSLSLSVSLSLTHSLSLSLLPILSHSLSYLRYMGSDRLCLPGKCGRDSTVRPVASLQHTTHKTRHK